MSPRHLYVAGVLWGTHSDADASPDELDEPADEGEERQKGPARSRAGASENAEEGAGLDDLDDEQVAVDVDAFGKRRSIAMSFRVPGDVASAELELSFGTYSPFSLPTASRTEQFWRRTDHRHSTVLGLGESTEGRIEAAPLNARFGSTVRPEVNGSRLVTVWVRNDTGAADVEDFVEGALFQVQLSLRVSALLPYAGAQRVRDSLDLLYSDVIEYAVGHGTDVDVSSDVDGMLRISTVALPVVEVPALTPDVADGAGRSYRVGMRDLAEGNDDARLAIERLIADYAAWVDDRAAEAAQLDLESQPIALAHVGRCAEFLEQVRAGWRLVLDDRDVAECLHDASRAMDSQRQSMQAAPRAVALVDGAITVEGTSPHHDASAEQGYWRPFQVAFVLASLPKIVDAAHPERSTVDVIWMPTGGGKTEAYLGLAAFTILWERLTQEQGKAPKRFQCTKVLMRYTLRLLTVQQFLRSAALVCALEIVRRQKPDRYGKGEVRIGTWVGRSTTDNKRKDAVAKLKSAAERGEEHGFLLTQCPWCAARMGEVVERSVVGFRPVDVKDSRTKRTVKRVLATCPDPLCDFAYRTVKNGDKTLERGIPVMTVDEDVYDFPPDFVIGTVDKVAMMWDQIDAQHLFGLFGGERHAAPPALFIQDELHLITGPLGSLDGAFEVMLETLCTAKGGRAPVYVASTATTRNFAAQIGALYDRRSALVPPPGLTVADSFFSRLDSSLPGRLYAGVCSTGGVANAEAQARVLATLAHFAEALSDLAGPGVDHDPYWTNVCFFSSRASLGTLTSHVEGGMRGLLDAMRRSSGTSSGSIGDDGARRTVRYISQPREITATASENVTEVLDDLGLRRSAKGSIDLCFATSMIEVGLDVPRLGLMTVIGQPKGSSQYIQVTGRVGRSAKAPALVVDVLGTRTPRDRSHYEHFTAWHRRLYASVEGASVTPFTERALERTLPTIAAVLCRVLGGAGTIDEQVERTWPTITTAMTARAARFGEREVAATVAELQRLRKSAAFPSVAALTWDNRARPEAKFLFAFGEPVPSYRAPDYWQVLTSMRNVDPDAAARARNPSGEPARPARGGGIDTDGEELA